MSKKSVLLSKVNAEILNCQYCLKSANGKIVPGEGSATADIVFVGEAPGKEEIKAGRPFIGRAGKILRELIASVGLEPGDVFITSAVKYLPKGYITPKPNDISHGRDHLHKQLNVINPKVIVVLGNTAATSLLQERFSISQNHGKIIHREKQVYFLSYHPAAPLYSPKLREVIFKDFKVLKRLLSK